jgi:hypothetical protein
MKKLILTLSYFFVLGYYAVAQEVPASAEKRIDLLTRVISTELQLNEAAYIKLRSLNRERILKSDEATAMYSDDAAVLTAKLTEIESDFDKKFATILNPVQLAAYKNYKQVTEESMTALKSDKAEVKSTTGKPASNAAQQKK